MKKFGIRPRKARSRWVGQRREDAVLPGAIRKHLNLMGFWYLKMTRLANSRDPRLREDDALHKENLRVINASQFGQTLKLQPYQNP
ncbi:MAG TPA: hypothetical protein DEA26_06000 [Oceanospirillales bacterium]|nr:hypothetical protein [Oceanospirillaceae bacterium]HBS42213.1 hypothetical protein [Oceanospirillales bacterium]